MVEISLPFPVVMAIVGLALIGALSIFFFVLMLLRID